MSVSPVVEATVKFPAPISKLPIIAVLPVVEAIVKLPPPISKSPAIVVLPVPSSTINLSVSIISPPFKVVDSVTVKVESKVAASITFRVPCISVSIVDLAISILFAVDSPRSKVVAVLESKSLTVSSPAILVFPVAVTVN